MDTSEKTKSSSSRYANVHSTCLPSTRHQRMLGSGRSDRGNCLSAAVHRKGFAALAPMSRRRFNWSASVAVWMDHVVNSSLRIWASRFPHSLNDVDLCLTRRGKSFLVPAKRPRRLRPLSRLRTLQDSGCCFPTVLSFLFQRADAASPK